MHLISTLPESLRSSRIGSDDVDWFVKAILDKPKFAHGEEKFHILTSDTWGDIDVEGKILCMKYGVKLHVKQMYEENHYEDLLLLKQLVTGSLMMVAVDGF